MVPGVFPTGVLTGMFCAFSASAASWPGMPKTHPGPPSEAERKKAAGSRFYSAGRQTPSEARPEESGWKPLPLCRKTNAWWRAGRKKAAGSRFYSAGRQTSSEAGRSGRKRLEAASTLPENKRLARRGGRKRLEAASTLPEKRALDAAAQTITYHSKHHARAHNSIPG